MGEDDYNPSADELKFDESIMKFFSETLPDKIDRRFLDKLKHMKDNKEKDKQKKIFKPNKKEQDHIDILDMLWAEE